MMEEISGKSCLSSRKAVRNSRTMCICTNPWRPPGPAPGVSSITVFLSRSGDMIVSVFFWGGMLMCNKPFSVLLPCKQKPGNHISSFRREVSLSA